MDGGSADASVAIAEAAGLLVVRHETRGRAAAINRGVQEATAPIICVLHADTLLPDDAVAVMRRVLADPGTALAGFTPLLSGPDRVRWGTSLRLAELNRSTRAPTKDRLIGKIMGRNPAFRGTPVPVHLLAASSWR